MELIQSVFSTISGLGNYIMIPIMIFIVGLLVRCKPEKALKAGLTVGIGLIGLDLVMGLVWTNISPVANLLVEKFGLELTTIDTGWATAAGLAFSTSIGAFIIPFILVVNIALLSIKATKTMNIDIWNYWHYAFSGAVVYLLTNNLIFGFTAAAVHCIVSLIIADRTASQVHKEMGLPGISIPQGFAVTEYPIFMALDRLYDLILPRSKAVEASTLEKVSSNKLLLILKDPIYLGLLIGSVLGFIVGYDVKSALTVGISMAALMFLLPRMVKVLMEGLLPISQAAKEHMSKRYQGQEIYIGMDSAVLLGHPTTLAVALLLIPITLVLAMILPGNTTLPLGDLAATAYFVSMASVIHKGKFGRVLISGTIMMGIVLLIASFFAPQLTQFAMAGAIAIPTGAAQITALSAGNLFALVLFWCFKLGWIGLALVLAATGVLVYLHRMYLAKQVKEFTE
ncbi:MAG: PTS transporter subunit IIC [Erysipelotrichaceae bacterium]|nr:PTS transporter subunit IIC [Erysipelotrichaceae bacterium]